MSREQSILLGEVEVGIDSGVVDRATQINQKKSRQAAPNHRYLLTSSQRNIQPPSYIGGHQSSKKKRNRQHFQRFELNSSAMSYQNGSTTAGYANSSILKPASSVKNSTDLSHF